MNGGNHSHPNSAWLKIERKLKLKRKATGGNSRNGFRRRSVAIAPLAFPSQDSYLRQLKILVSPPTVLSAFDATVGSIHLKMAHNDHQSRTLAALRDALLPKLLSGGIRVADAEKLARETP